MEAEDDQAVVALLEEHSYSIDKQGLATSTTRHVYHVRQREAVEYWSSIEREYQPWSEERPEIRARVISAGGTVRTLDPKTVADAATSQYDNTIYSDRRTVRAPLPGVEAGAVVEVEIRTEQTRNQLGAGSVRRIVVNQYTQLQQFRFSVEAHRQVPLRTALYRIPQESLRREESGKTVRYTLELGPLSVVERIDFNAPPDAAPQKRVEFSTGSSWQTLAAGYSETIDAKIAGAELSSFVEGLDMDGTPKEVAGRLTARLHERIRYTGVEFSEAEIVPVTPAETIARGYGDCKDKSTLLTALLRQAGLEARVALLAAGADADVPEELPGLGLFNHVIVRVGGEEPFWIDATAENVRVGVLPPMDEGRLALVAGPETTELARTPLSESKDNWLRRTTVLTMRGFGRGSTEVTTTLGGTLESEMRATFRTEESFAEAVGEGAEGLQGEVVHASTSGGSNYSKPFQLDAKIDRITAVESGFEQAIAAISVVDLFEHMPWGASPATTSRSGNSEDERKSDIWFGQPHQIELAFVVRPPGLFKVVSPPKSVEMKLGPASYSRTVEVGQDGELTVTYRLDSGKRRWTPEEAQEFLEGVKPYYSTDALRLKFISESAELSALGETEAAIKKLRLYTEQHPQDALGRARLARLLVSTGLGDEAKRVAQQAVEQAPESPGAWMALGWAHQHDAFGRRFRDDWDRDEAAKALKRAVELDPSSYAVSAELAILLEYDRTGERYGADLTESIEIYRRLLEEQSALPYHSNLVAALMRSGRLDEAREHVATLNQNAQVNYGLLLTALEEGPAAMILEAQALTANETQRSQALTSFGLQLIQMRRYQAAAPVMRAASRSGTSQLDQVLADELQRTSRYEDAELPADDPKTPARQVLTALLTGIPRVEELQGLFTPREDWEAWRREMTRLRPELGGVIAPYSSKAMPRRLAIDILLSTFDRKASVEGMEDEEEDGKRLLRVRTGGMPDLFVLSEDGEHHILGSGENLAEIGKLIWGLLAAGEMDVARNWLDRATTDLPREESKTPPPEMLWPRAVLSVDEAAADSLRTEEAARAAAASMVGRSEKSEEAIEILRAAAERATVAIDRNQANVALAEALAMAERWKELAEVGEKLGAASLFSGEGFDFAIRGYVGGEDWEGLADFAEPIIDESPTAIEALKAAAEAAAHLGDSATATNRLKELLEVQYISEDDRAAAAWITVLAGQSDPETLGLLDEKLGEVGAEPAFHFSRAMLRAAVKKTDLAIGSLRLGVEKAAVYELGPKAFYIQSLICDSLGLTEAADAAAERARREPVRDDMDRWALALLEKGSAELEQR